MKTTIKSLFFLLFASAFLVACEDCGSASITEPTATDAQWLVYENGDTAVFKDETGAEIQFVRTGIYVQNTPGDGYSVGDECVEKLNTQITNIMEHTNRTLPYLGTFILTKPDSLLVRVGVGDSGAWDIATTEETKEVKLGNRTYSNVYVVEGTGAKENDVKTLFFSKSNGFEYIEFRNGKKLELVQVK